MNDLTAILITGGMGTRLRPIAVHYAKSMLPWMGRPLLEKTVRQLKSAGITDLVFTSSGRSGEIWKHFGDGTKFGVVIEYPPIDRWRGTAGTVARVVRALARPSTPRFLVIYGDSLLRADFKQLVEAHDTYRAEVTILCHRPRFESFLYDYHDGALPNRGPRTNYGLMEANSRGQLSRFEEKPPLEDIKKFSEPTANAAVYVVNRSIFDRVPASDAEYDFAMHMFPALIKEGRMCFRSGIGRDGYRVDLGTISNYYHAIGAALRADILVDHYFPERPSLAHVAPDAQIGPAASFDKCVIGNRCRIGAGSRIEMSILGDDVTLDDHCTVTNSIIMDGASIGRGVVLDRCMLGEQCSILEEARLPAGSIIGPNCHLPGPDLSPSYQAFLGQVKNGEC
jgi:mannose-1-phosphate guanylyltransferase